jgi:heme-degrading monooxygenase HmoA
MYIAMNRFQIAPGQEQNFEKLWRERETHLKEVQGFQVFHLLRGAQEETHTLFATHVIWDSREAFENWTKSEQFRKVHAGTAGTKGIYLDRPRFEGFEVVMAQFAGD